MALLLRMDGAAAVILASEDKAREICDNPVWIEGVGNCSDGYLRDRDLGKMTAMKTAAEKAYAMAGVKDPAREIDVVELYDAFSYQELLWLEGLGLCPEGGAGRLIDDGVTSMDGALPVNPSGGCLSAHAVLVAGMVRLIEGVLQLRGEAGDRQVAGCRRALAHGTNGPCGPSHCVMVLEP